MNEQNRINSRSNFGFFGWMLVIYCFATFFLTSFLSSSLNIVSGIFAEVNGWSQTYLMSLVTIGGWVGVLAVYVAGLLLASGKVKLRSLGGVSAVIVGATTLFWGYTHNLFVFTCLFVAYQAAYTIWAQLANQTLMNNWFPRKKGLAIGWATTGFPLAAGPGVAVFAIMMGKIGFANCFLIVGIIIIIVGIVGSLVFTEYPEQRGCFPDNDRTLTSEQAAAELEAGRRIMEKSPWTTRRLLATRDVWLLSLASGYMLMFASGSILQVVPRLMAIGYEQGSATGMLTVAALCALPGSYLVGVLDTKLGTKTAVIITCLVSAGACVLYCIPNNAAIWIALVLIGASLGGTSNFTMSLTGTYFGRYNFQKAFGTVLCITQLVGQSGAAVIAILADIWNYSMAYTVMAGLGLLAAVLMAMVKDDFVAKREAQFAVETK